MEIVYWMWLTLGLVLLIVEVAVPSFFAMFFGISALVVGILTYFCPESSFLTQGLVFVVLATVIAFVFFKFIRPRLKTVQEGKLMDEVGVLIKKHDNHNGAIRFFSPIKGRDTWQVESEEVLEADAYYRVISVCEKSKTLKVVKNR